MGAKYFGRQEGEEAPGDDDASSSSDDGDREEEESGSEGEEEDAAVSDPGERSAQGRGRWRDVQFCSGDSWPRPVSSSRLAAAQ